MIRSIASVLVAAVAVALAARVDVPVPGSPVPQSLQTLAVVLAGAALGPARGSLAMALYLLGGAVGAPVFAAGTSGFDVLVGPTGGYLFGFPVGAVLVGAAARWDRRRPTLLGKGLASAGGSAGAPRAGAVVTASSLAAHFTILGLGWARLGAMMGASAAFSAGFVPFLAGAVAKSIAAGTVWTGVIAIRAARFRGPRA